MPPARAVWIEAAFSATTRVAAGAEALAAEPSLATLAGSHHLLPMGINVGLPVYYAHT